ncbi:hypothetical protein LN042_26295 [Kitasatospora sp. RB6PN24]|uniref:hypothetical protein n=1 Tax=Kitasatospora humi TaxID=2893891 RepID=UPI001E58A072|nr:hypothetical protein [Kitasatospora humi]MCC9310540.1 hypothetical protein [Kitasatospora humi]
MGTTHNTSFRSGARTGPGTAGGAAGARRGEAGGAVLGAVWRFLPAAAALAVLLTTLSASDTPVNSIARYAGYVAWGVLLPGTLVYRSLRRTPHTLVEDLAMGAVTGLALELAAWAVFVPLHLQSVVTLWPLLVVIPFAAVPRLRRHWWVRGYHRVPLGWSWSLAATVAITSGYLYQVYLVRTPILPPDDRSRQFVDLSYQMSLAGNAKHSFPVTLPQVAGEPLQYHWFAFAHEAMTSLVGHLDLPVVQLRLMIPALCALTMVVAAVVAWRLSGRAWAGPIAGLLLFAVGEFNASHAMTPFGSPETTLMSWASVSMTYSQPLLLALVGAVGDGLRRPGTGTGGNPVPALGRGCYALAAFFAFASSAAKATSLPVTLAALALTGLLGLLTTRRIPWTVVGLGAIVAAAQLFSTAVIFAFKSYGLAVEPLSNLQGSWADPHHARTATSQLVVVALVWFAFLINTQLRVAGALPLLWRSRLKPDPTLWFLVGGTVAGPAIYLALNGWNSSYFTHAGLAFGVLLSAWGYCEAFERAALSPWARTALGAFAAAFTGLIVWGVYYHAGDWQTWVTTTVKGWHPTRSGFLRAFLSGNPDGNGSAAGLLPIVSAGLALCAIAAVCGVLWWALGRVVKPMRRRGGIVLLTAALLAGAPALVIDLPKPTWDMTVWSSFPLPAGKIDAARWLRDHSRPTDVIATNEHCWSPDDFQHPGSPCTDYRDFTLSAYSERSVLVEGWAFAPRVMAGTSPEFWDPALLRMNDDAVYHPTAPLLSELHDRHHVRYLFVNRRVGPEAPQLGTLTDKVYDNGRIAIYELR